MFRLMMVLNESNDGMTLSYLLEGLADFPSDIDCEITGLCLDSRQAGAGDLFLACRGQKTHGARYIEDAINAGVAVVAIESGAMEQPVDFDIPIVTIDKLGDKAGFIAARFYGKPSEHLDVVGITGTNGKTSVSHFIAQALSVDEKQKAGLVGTLGYGLYGQLQSTKNTTPDPVTLQRVLAEMRQQGASTAVMEVSSHGLEQGRTNGVNFNIGVFTNLSRDHLDYHRDMNAYAEAKKSLFFSPELNYAVINTDDEYGKKLAVELGDHLHVIRYGLEKSDSVDTGSGGSFVSAVIRKNNVDYLELDIKSPWGKGQLELRAGGEFNAYNALASLAVLCLLKIPFEQALTGLSGITPIPGRMESFTADGMPHVIVDYAHTPDALEKALIALRNQCRGRLHCVFGCGGNRDREKRPQMGRFAEKYADRIIVTNDNPRTEDPQIIIDDILSGIKQHDAVVVKPERSEAISFAIESANESDIVLVAGKGHETYQEMSGQRYPFSDRQLVRNLLGAGT